MRKYNAKKSKICCAGGACPACDCCICICTKDLKMVLTSDAIKLLREALK